MEPWINFGHEIIYEELYSKGNQQELPWISQFGKEAWRWGAPAKCIWSRPILRCICRQKAPLIVFHIIGSFSIWLEVGVWGAPTKCTWSRPILRCICRQKALLIVFDIIRSFAIQMI